MTSGKELLKMGKFPVVTMLLQVAFVILFGCFVDYTPYGMRTYLPTPATSQDPNQTSNASSAPDQTSVDDAINSHISDSKMNVMQFYGMFQHLHVMMYVGFGFLVTFIKRYGYGSVSFTFMLGAMVTQWATLTAGWIISFDQQPLLNHRIQVDLMAMVNIEFCIAAVLISYCAVIGKTTPLQLLVLGMIETVVFQVNCLIVYNKLWATDTGTSMTVHTFGGFYGLTVAWILYKKDLWEAKDKDGSQYHSDIFAMIGTIFLWMYYPSFNCLTTGHEEGRYRGIINTYYALASSCVTTFAMSAFVSKGKLNMVHIQNSALAGGVSVGTVGDLIIYPWGALLVGMVAAVVSVFGFRFLVKRLALGAKLHDTCGISSLHAMPGVISGLAGILVAGIATEKVYGESLFGHFPEMRNGRTSGQQAGYQCLALVSSILTAIVGGIITGLILKIPIWDQPKGRENLDDSTYFLMPEEGFVSDTLTSVTQQAVGPKNGHGAQPVHCVNLAYSSSEVS